MNTRPPASEAGSRLFHQQPHTFTQMVTKRQRQGSHTVQSFRQQSSNQIGRRRQGRRLPYQSLKHIISFTSGVSGFMSILCHAAVSRSFDGHLEFRIRRFKRELRVFSVNQLTAECPGHILFLSAGLGDVKEEMSMNIGIIVFSRTGNTLAVAERIREACAASGHAATVEQIRIEDDKPGSGKPPRLTETPDPARYDRVYMGAAVEAFSLSPVMKAYMDGLAAFDGKSTGVFVTQHFPKPWMGGNRAIRQLRALCRAKGLNVQADGIVNWTNKARDAQIKAVAGRFASL
jgi:hypothetical protein